MAKRYSEYDSLTLMETSQWKALANLIGISENCEEVKLILKRGKVATIREIKMAAAVTETEPSFYSNPEPAGYGTDLEDK